MKELYKKIEMYFDGELEREEECALFSGLATDEDGRRYFRDAQLLKLALKNSAEEFPAELDKKILGGLNRYEREDNTKFSRYAAYAASAAAVVLFALTIFIFSEFNEYRYRLTELDHKIKEQNLTIEMLYNSYPTVTVKPTINY